MGEKMVLVGKPQKERVPDVNGRILTWILEK
jgi:hypothetical protein